MQCHIYQNRTQYFPEIPPQENRASLFNLSADQQLFTRCSIFAGEDQGGKKSKQKSVLESMNVSRDKEAAPTKVQ